MCKFVTAVLFFVACIANTCWSTETVSLESPVISEEAADSASTTPIVAIAHVDGMISELQKKYFEQALKDAKAQGATVFVTHITSFGGYLNSGHEMLNIALSQADDDLRMIAFVDSHAISAAAMLAYGHDEIYLNNRATIGDIGVINQGADGEIKYAPEKIETMVRARCVLLRRIKAGTRPPAKNDCS